MYTKYTCVCKVECSLVRQVVLRTGKHRRWDVQLFERLASAGNHGIHARTPPQTSRTITALSYWGGPWLGSHCAEMHSRREDTMLQSWREFWGRRSLHLLPLSTYATPPFIYPEIYVYIYQCIYPATTPRWNSLPNVAELNAPESPTHRYASQQYFTWVQDCVSLCPKLQLHTEKSTHAWFSLDQPKLDRINHF